MGRPASSRTLRRKAIQTIDELSRLALEKRDYAAGAFSIRLEQMASRLARLEQEKAQQCSGTPTSQTGISIGRGSR
jgi:hypothetical protein